MRDLIIGMATKYDWEQLEPFVLSIMRSGFDGDKVLFVRDNPKETLDRLLDLGFTLLQLSPRAENEPKYFPYVQRFLLIHQFLVQHPYRYVFCADTRDLVFQHNPTTWVEEHIGESKLIVAPEYIAHKDQAGNMAWLHQGFAEVESWMAPRPIFCSGLISGQAAYVRDLSLAIYLMARHLSEHMWGSDQPVFNFIMQQKAYSDITLVPAMKDHWAVNCCVLSSTSNRRAMFDAPPPRPFVTDWNYGIPDLSEFTIVHQYDRIPPLQEIIQKRYKSDL